MKKTAQYYNNPNYTYLPAYHAYERWKYMEQLRNAMQYGLEPMRHEILPTSDELATKFTSLFVDLNKHPIVSSLAPFALMANPVPWAASDLYNTAVHMGTAVNPFSSMPVKNRTGHLMSGAGSLLMGALALGSLLAGRGKLVSPVKRLLIRAFGPKGINVIRRNPLMRYAMGRTEWQKALKKAPGLFSKYDQTVGFLPRLKTTGKYIGTNPFTVSMGLGLGGSALANSGLPEYGYRDPYSGRLIPVDPKVIQMMSNFRR